MMTLMERIDAAVVEMYRLERALSVAKGDILRIEMALQCQHAYMRDIMDLWHQQNPLVKEVRP